MYAIRSYYVLLQFDSNLLACLPLPGQLLRPLVLRLQPGSQGCQFRLSLLNVMFQLLALLLLGQILLTQQPPLLQPMLVLGMIQPVPPVGLAELLIQGRFHRIQPRLQLMQL